MSLRDAQQRQEVKSQPPCIVVTFIESLNDDDRATFFQWIEEGRAPSWIEKVASSDGKKINDKSLKGHLAGECVCRERGHRDSPMFGYRSIGTATDTASSAPTSRRKASTHQGKATE